MRYAIVFVVLSLGVSGCATSVQPNVERDYAPSTSTINPPAPALVFDPPGCSPVDLERHPVEYVVPDDVIPPDSYDGQATLCVRPAVCNRTNIRSTSRGLSNPQPATFRTSAAFCPHAGHAGAGHGGASHRK